MDKTNILTVVLEFSLQDLFGKTDMGLVGVVAQSYTKDDSGNRVPIDRLGRPEVTNVTLVSRNDSEDVRDYFNVAEPFGDADETFKSKIRNRIVENVTHYDAIDKVSQWSQPQKQTYAQIIVNDFMLFNMKANSSKVRAQYYSVEKELLQGGNPSSFGGRDLLDDFMDTLFSQLISRGATRFSDRVDGPYKQPIASFPYLAEPDQSWAGWAKAKLARFKLGIKGHGKLVDEPTN